MRLKVYRLSWILACSMLLGGVNTVLADDPEAPAYQNPAQAAHAANVSEAALVDANEDVEEANAAVAQAEKDLADAKEGLTEEEQLTDPDVQAAEAALEEAEEALDDAVGRVAGLEDGTLVGDLRASGMGWGEIAHELGVHPSVLGLGHTKAHGFKSGAAPVDNMDEIAVSTSMNLKTGKSKGHGEKTAGNTGGNGAFSSSGKSKGSNGNKGGNGKGGGIGGGKGGEKGGGKGGGNGNGGGKGKS